MFRVACAAALAAILAIVPAASPASAEAQTSTASPDARADVEPRRLSRAEFLALVERLIRAGQLDEVLALISRLPDEGSWAFDKRFIAAKIARLRGDPWTAEKIYRAMLAADPNLHRVRLELAQSLFERGNFEAADYHFRLVLAADIPPEVQRRIKGYLAQMRRDKWWTAAFNFAIVPDSNINTGPSTREVTIFGLPFQLDDEATEKSGVGIEASVSGDVRPKVGQDLRWAIGGRLYTREFSGNKFDDRTVSLYTGPVHSHSRGEVGLYALGARRWYANEPYSTSIGARAFGDYDVTSRWQAEGGVTFLDIDYDEGRRLDGAYYGIDTRLAYTFDDRSIARVFGGFAIDDRNDSGESYNQYGFGVGYSRELPLGLIGYIAPELRLRDYHGKSSIFDEVRNDILYRLEGRLIIRQQIIRDFAPFVTIALERNQSNIEFYQYDRVRGSIGFTKRF